MCILYNGNPNESLNILKYKRLPPAWLMFSLMFSHQLLLHQNFIASGYLTRFVNGKAVSCYQMNGVGRKLIWAGCQFQQMCPQHQKSFKVIRCNCNTNCRIQRCSCKKHGMNCSHACGNCKGSVCQNASLFDVSDDEEPIE